MEGKGTFPTSIFLFSYKVELLANDERPSLVLQRLRGIAGGQCAPYSHL